MNTRFSSAAELLALVAESGLHLPAFMLERDSFLTGKSVAETHEELFRRMAITRQSLQRGLSERQSSFSGMTGGNAILASASADPPVRDGFFNKAVAYSLAVNEVSACGGKVVAFPTGGSCGIVPGVLWAWHDERETGEPFRSDRMAEAFLCASAVGIVIATKATLSGAAGGCQAECGAASAMAAGALSWLMRRDAGSVFNAAALALKNSLGLACDPVAGLVEVPCVKRNAFMAVAAITAASLDAAGIRSYIPFDEVVEAMRSIGESMPSSLRESAEGGLAMTPTGKTCADRVR
ncbi:MAG: L-serine ammonia-lyase, iron-sulfur-dependent, subunit alpha [Spirochaetes bacterium]|nr:L-serine ammonia-lyase, iron-sulfur-dependent, subunit alpha [Spirochaetota bacterium]